MYKLLLTVRGSLINRSGSFKVELFGPRNVQDVKRLGEFGNFVVKQKKH